MIGECLHRAVVFATLAMLGTKRIVDKKHRAVVVLCTAASLRLQILQ